MGRKNKNICSGLCGICREWKKDFCEGRFKRFIKDDEGNILVGYDGRYLKYPIEIYIEVCQKMKKLGYISKDKLMEKVNTEYDLDITDSMLKYCVLLGLVEKGIREGVDGITGSVSFWKDDTPKLLYVIRTLKESGYKIKLEKMKYWLDLLSLDKESVEEIGKIILEDQKFNNLIEGNIGITLDQKRYLLRNYPLRLFDYKKLITRLDILNRVIKERTYIELDLTDLMIEISKDMNKHDEFLETENYPEISINLNLPEIRVIYKEPINKIMVFSDKI
jgi:hypothetical protein